MPAHAAAGRAWGDTGGLRPPGPGQARPLRMWIGLRKMRRQHSRPKTTKLDGLGEWENKLQQKFATHVSILPGKKGGKVEFEFYSQEDLERLLEAWGVM